MDKEEVKIQTSTFKAIAKESPNGKKHCLVKKTEKRFMYICQAVKPQPKASKIFATGKFFVVDLTSGVAGYIQLSIRYKDIKNWDVISNYQGEINIDRAMRSLRSLPDNAQKRRSTEVYKLLGYEQK